MNRGLDWMEQAACAERPGLPWTADAGTFPDVLADLMAEICAVCPVHAACDTYAADSVTAGFWAGTSRDADSPTRVEPHDVDDACDDEDPGEVEQPTLPFGDAAA